MTYEDVTPRIPRPSMRKRRIYQARPSVDGGLCCHPACGGTRPEHATPPIPALRDSSSRTFGWGFLQTTPRDAAPALLLPFGSTLRSPLRVNSHLVRGLLPRKSCAMPGAHVSNHPPARSAVSCMPLLGGRIHHLMSPASSRGFDSARCSDHADYLSPQPPWRGLRFRHLGKAKQAANNSSRTDR